MANMAKGRFSRAMKEEMQYLIQKPRVEVREEKQSAVVFPGHGNVKAVMKRTPDIIRQNHMDGCLPCQYATARNLQTT
jgi:hypothetical protein